MIGRRPRDTWKLSYLMILIGCGRLDIGGSARLDAAGALGAGGPSDSGGSDRVMPVQPSNVVITEIMYAPVAEDADEDNHEFLEIYNRSKTLVSLDGWRLKGDKGMSFTFAANTAIAAGGYRVIAKNRKLLADVAGYGLVARDLLGDYDGELGNGGDVVVLSDSAGNVVDAVKYDDKFPWPVAADQLGVGEDWLPDDQRPLTKHRYQGRSLERISAEFISASPANWEASALDGATPGKANSVAGTPLPIVEAYGATSAGGDGTLIHSDQSVTIKAVFSDFAPASAVEVEYFVDDIAQSRPPAPAKVPMLPDTAGVYSAVLGRQRDNAVVRYRIRAARGASARVVAPRATDPYPRAISADPDGWFTYFVSPRVLIRSGSHAGAESKARAIHLFIKPADWSRLEQWLAKDRAADLDRSTAKYSMGGCPLNPDWDSVVPATLIYEGQAHDVRVRYEGGWWNRSMGFPIAKWPYPGPQLPPGKDHLAALSWQVKLPRYSRTKGIKTLLLKKQLQGCPGTITYVEGQLLARAGQALQKTGGQPIPIFVNDYVRLYINGGYYHYVEQQEDIDDLMIQRVYGSEPVGDLYKDNGSSHDLGPTGSGNFDFNGRMQPNAFCPQHTVAERYAATYVRKTHEYRPYDEIIKLVTDLSDARDKDAAARAAGRPGFTHVKDYLDKYWEHDTLLTSFAVRNWSGGWDDTFHNFFLYKNPGTGRWLLIYSDLEWDFGLGNFGIASEAKPANIFEFNPKKTFYTGWKTGADACVWNACELVSDPTMCAMDLGDRCNPPGFNALKDAFIGTYRAEFDEKIRQLVADDLLSAKGVLALIDEGIARFSLDDWLDDPVDKTACNVDRRHEAMKAWARVRHETVLARLCQSSPAPCAKR